MELMALPGSNVLNVRSGLIDYFRKTNPWPDSRMPQLHSFVKRITN